MKDAGRAAREHGWTKRFELTDKLRYLLTVALAATPLPFWPGEGNPQLVLFSDASSESWGAVLQCAGQQDLVLSEDFTSEMQGKHITVKETLAPAIAIAQLLPAIPNNAQLSLHLDAVTAVRAWSKGSRLEHLTALVRPTVIALAKKGVALRAQYTKGEENIADFLSSRGLSGLWYWRRLRPWAARPHWLPGGREPTWSPGCEWEWAGAGGGSTPR